METSSAVDQEAAKKGNLAAFVRGFFCSLEANGTEAAVLHGWEGAFEGPLGDVDFVVSRDGFRRIAELVHGYCRDVGWRLCQVLRHESTAAFCVCSWEGDPARVVALDGCGDYRRRERVLMAVEELLKERQQLPWGGFRLSESNELRYRFLKGAVKRKNASGFGPVLAAYSEPARDECRRWLSERWGIELAAWTIDCVTAAWNALDRRTLQERPQGWLAVRRVASRMLHPTGLVVVGGEESAALTARFGRLYFRRTARLDRWSAGCLRALISSSLLSVGHLGAFWRLFLGRWLWLEVRDGETAAELDQRIACHLAWRCACWERLPGPNPAGVSGTIVSPCPKV